MITLHERRRRGGRRASAEPGPAGLPSDYRVSFGACYVYSPKGCNAVSGQSRLLCARVKRASAKWLECCAARVREEALRQRFGGLFNLQTMLVPIPGNGPSRPRAFWPARGVAVALQAVGLAGSVWTGLSRVTAVERSSAAWIWQRPTVQDHYQSFAVGQSSTVPTQIVLVDDVITKGRTLVAAAIRLHEAFPLAQVRAFALLRTMGFVSQIERLVDPCRGEIHWNGEDAYREP